MKRPFNFDKWEDGVWYYPYVPLIITPLPTDVSSLEEYNKCKDSPSYFIRTYCSVYCNSILALFDVYDYQEDLVDYEFANNNWNIILKPRGIGLTSIKAAYALHSILFNHDYGVMILTHHPTIAREIMSTIQTMYWNLPDRWLKLANREDNRRIELKNGSYISTMVLTDTPGKGESLSMVMVDDVGHDRYFEQYFPIFQVLLKRDAKFIISGSAIGNDRSWFARKWKSAVLGENEFNPIKLHWSQNPTNTVKWKHESIKQMGKVTWMQEMECEFFKED